MKQAYKRFDFKLTCEIFMKLDKKGKQNSWDVNKIGLHWSLWSKKKCVLFLNTPSLVRIWLMQCQFLSYFY